MATDRSTAPGSLADPPDATPSSDPKVFVTRVINELHKTDPRAAERLSQAVDDFPETGSEFLGFRLLAELGRGAFARVFLARQGELADRPVVLKVSMDAESESFTLAQLVHTNIVPVYSIHRADLFQAVCMPWLGRTTLADVLESLRGECQTPTSGWRLISTIVARGTLVDLPGLLTPPASLPSGRGPAGLATSSEGYSPSLSPPSSAAPLTPEAKQGGHGSRAILEMLGRISYVDAVVWVMGRLADGLAYAHERGILHRDLKPANILVTAEGQPMLLDFNLAEDTKLRRAGVYAEAGGTILYMSPEQLEAFRGMLPLHADGRSDLYALGVIFCELLTLRFPFFSWGEGPLAIIDSLLAEQRAGPPALRPFNPDIPPAIESIVRHCLEPDPARRYQFARDLLEDIELHRANKPLRHAPNPSLRERLVKWARRHPRLSSAGSLATLAGVLILGLVFTLLMVRHRLLSNEAQEAARQVELKKGLIAALFSTAPLDRARYAEGQTLAREQLHHFLVLDRPADWERKGPLAYLSDKDRAKTRRNLRELLFILSWGRYEEVVPAGSRQEGDEEKLEEALALVRAAQRCYPEGEAPISLSKYESVLLSALGRPDTGEDPRLLDISDAKTGGDCFLDGSYYANRGRFRDAATLLERATLLEPQHFASWFVLGYCYGNLERHKEAAWCYSVAISLRPDFARAWYHRGLSRLQYDENKQAWDDFAKAVDLDPGLADAWISRAVASRRLGDNTRALGDLDEALRLPTSCTRAYFMRARLHREAGRTTEAQRDEKEGLSREPTNDIDRVMRGFFRMGREPQAALEDFEAVLRVNPRFHLAWQNKALVLAEKLGRLEEAIRTLEAALQRFPDANHLRVCRGVYLARCGHRGLAHADALACKPHGNRSFAAVADLCATGAWAQPTIPWGVALRSDLFARLGGDPDDPGTVYRLACIYALTSPGHLDDQRESLYYLKLALEKGFDPDVVARDADVAALRNLPGFRALLTAAQERKAKLDTRSRR